MYAERAAANGGRRASSPSGRPRASRSRVARRPADAGQSRPWRSARPGVAPVCTPSSTTSVPSLTNVLDARSGNCAARRTWPWPDRRRVEHDDVGHEAVGERPAVAQAEAGGRRAGHLVHRLLEREQRLVAHELAEDPRERAVASAGSACRRRTSSPCRPSRPDGRRTGGASRSRPARHLVDAEVLGRAAGRRGRRPRRAPVSVMTSPIGPALPAQVLGPREVRRAGGPPSPPGRRRQRRGPGARRGCARATAGSARRSFERPGPPAWTQMRQQDEEPRARPLVRIGVERDVEALGARVVDEREHLLGAARDASCGGRSG